MKMRPRGPAGGSRQTHLLALLHLVAFLHRQFRQMHVDGHELLAVVDDHAIALIEEWCGENHFAGVGSHHRRARRCVIVHSLVNAGELTVEGAARSESLGGLGIHGHFEAARPFH